MTKSYTPQDILSLSVETEEYGTLSLGAYLSVNTYDFLMLGDNFEKQTDRIWRENMAHAMILEGYIDGELDSSGSVTDYDRRQLNTALETAFDLLKQADYTSLDYPPEPKDHYLVGIDEDGEMCDYYPRNFTKAEAEKELERASKEGAYGTWRVVHIPKVT